MSSDEIHEALNLRVLISESGFPAVPTLVHQSSGGTSYLTEPGVAMVAKPNVSLDELEPFLLGFDQDLSFNDYLSDPVQLTPGASLCKMAGQNCYASWGPRRSDNSHATTYFDNIKSSGHGSVLEHAVYSFHLYGVSRSFTHELVRHRAGFAYSQLSQRYVSGNVLRFVERPEFQSDEHLHRLFTDRIDRVAKEYDTLTQQLLEQQVKGTDILTAENRTDRRKRVQQAARSLLTNEVEAPIVVTANARAWRHFIEMRASPHADIEIRLAAIRIFACLHAEEPIIFGDYEPVQLSDGTATIVTKHAKV